MGTYPPHRRIQVAKTITKTLGCHSALIGIRPQDGNGRLGRALAEKSLAQNIGQPSLIALAYTIERDRKGYYAQLETHQKTLDVTGWLLWFAETVLEAQQATLTRVAFFIAKAKFYDGRQRWLSACFVRGPRGSKASSAPRITLPSLARRARPRPGTCRISWRWARSAEPGNGGIRGIG